MKHPLLMAILAAGCIGLAQLGCQTARLEQVFQPQASTHSSEMPEAVEADSKTGIHLVQEPSRRSAMRPNFFSGRNVNIRSSAQVMSAFNEAVGDNWKSTVQIYNDSQPCALGTVVGAEGWIVTKASQIDQQSQVFCGLHDRRQLKATVLASDVELDLALLHVDAIDLNEVRWDLAVPEQGRWLATPDTRAGLPTAIGVVSAGISRIPGHPALLGVKLKDSEDSSGAIVSEVVTGSGADQAGLKSKDIVRSVNGKPVSSPAKLTDIVRSLKGGQYLTLTIDRDQQKLEKRVRLMDLTIDLQDETEMEVNGPVSARATGFSRVFMHDSVILPDQCGGPVINLEGKAVGINIARAGRVATYALPADLVKPAVSRLLQQAKIVQRSSPSPVLTDSAEAPLATAP